MSSRESPATPETLRETRRCHADAGSAAGPLDPVSFPRTPFNSGFQDIPGYARDPPRNSARPTISSADTGSAAGLTDPARLPTTPCDSLHDSRSSPSPNQQPAHTRSLTPNKFYLFWQRDSVLSQWYMSDAPLRLVWFLAFSCFSFRVVAYFLSEASKSHYEV